MGLFGWYFIKKIFFHALSSPSGPPEVLVSWSLRLCSIFLNFFSFGSSDWIISIDISSRSLIFFCYPDLLLSPSSKFFVFGTILFNFRIYMGFFYIISVPLLRISLFVGLLFSLFWIDRNLIFLKTFIVVNSINSLVCYCAQINWLFTKFSCCI